MTFQQSRMNKGARPHDHGVGLGEDREVCLSHGRLEGTVGAKFLRYECAQCILSSKETSVACSYSKDVMF